MVVVLLGSLSYGAYAFGRYVLSAYMFTGVATADQKDVDAVASSTKVADTVTRKTKYEGSAPRVEVEVLPAEDAGRAPDVPPLSVLRREVEKIKPRPETDDKPAPKADNPPPKRVRDIDQVSGAESTRNGGDDGNDDKPREPRRRRRSRSNRSTERKSEAAVRVVRPSTRSDDNSNSDSSDAGDAAPRERASNDGASDRAANIKPPQRRSRERVKERAREESPRPRSESPVPRAEGQSSGGDSPVPQAE